MPLGAKRDPGSRAPIRCAEYVYQFKDHADKPATVTYTSFHYSTLPPLASYALYFVNAATSTPLPDSSATLLARTIRHEVAEGDYRLELFYLPGANAKRCMLHHMIERAMRGTYTRQMEAVEKDQQPEHDGEISDEEVFHPSRLPGYPPSYKSSEYDAYHQLFFICHDAAWGEGSGLLERVEYEPIDPQEYGERSFDPEELAADPNIAILPAISEGTFHAISRPHFGTEDTDENGKWIEEVSHTIKFRSYFNPAYNPDLDIGEPEHAGLFQEARDKGWMHW